MLSLEQLLASCVPLTGCISKGPSSRNSRSGFEASDFMFRGKGLEFGVYWNFVLLPVRL